MLLLGREIYASQKLGLAEKTHQLYGILLIVVIHRNVPLYITLYIDINGHCDHYVAIATYSQKIPYMECGAANAEVSTHYIVIRVSYSYIANHKTFPLKHFMCSYYSIRSHIEACTSLTVSFTLQLDSCESVVISSQQVAKLTGPVYLIMEPLYTCIYIATYSVFSVVARVQRIFEKVLQWVLPGLLLIIELGG